MEVFLGAAVALVLGYAVWAAFRGREEEPPPEDDAADRQKARELTAFWLSLKDCYPYLPTPRVKDTTSDSVAGGIAEIFADWQEYGWAPRFNYLPVPALPPKERRRHLYVMGNLAARL